MSRTALENSRDWTSSEPVDGRKEGREPQGKQSPTTHVDITCKMLRTAVRFRTTPPHLTSLGSTLFQGMAPRVSFVCPICSKPFTKAPKEVRRQKKQGREHFYCSRSCSVVNCNRTTGRGNLSNFGKNRGRPTDPHSPFRWFIGRAKQRKKHVTNITMEYLKELWETQEGICPFTGWGLILPYGALGFKEGSDPLNASLDRINCAQGYLEGNVRFISVMANLARNRFTDAQVREFCQAVVAFSN